MSDKATSVKPGPKTLAFFELITAPLKKDNGFRHLWLGDTGMGKTYANRMLVDYIRAQKLVDLIFTLDDKDAHAAQYIGIERINPSDLRSKPPMPNDKGRDHIVFRGVALTRRLSEGCTPDDLAKLAWEVGTQRKTRIVINIDELADATNGSQAWKDKTVAMSYRKGRGVGICITATTQLPQILPRESYGLSDTIGLFRMAGREADYLESKKSITQEAARRVPTLEIGECLIYDKSRGPLDGQVIKIGD